MLSTRNSFLFTLFLIVAAEANGQQNTRSPYSLFGVGLLHYDGFSDHAAVGRNGASYRFESNYSLINPASLSALNHSAFNVGAYMDMGKLMTSTTVQNFSNAGLGYLSLGAPLKKINGGFAVGLLPYSDVGYNIINVKDSSGISVRNEFEGSGGLAKFNLGFGMKVWKYASVGFNYGYIFGQMDETARRRYPGNRIMTSYAENNNVLLRGHHLDLAAQFHLTADSGISHVLGIVVSNKTKLRGDLERLGYTYTEIFTGSELVRDTIFNDTVRKTLTLPLSLSLSYSIGRNEKWQLSAGYNRTLWSNYRSIYGDNSQLSNDQRYSLGGFICLNPVYDKTVKNNKIMNYVKSIRYSAGAFHSDGYLYANGQRISETGISAGFGFPFTKVHKKRDGTRVIITSRIFLTGELIRRGAKTNGLIQEDFLRFTLGLNLSDSWFNKNLFD